MLYSSQRISVESCRSWFLSNPEERQFFYDMQIMQLWNLAGNSVHANSVGRFKARLENPFMEGRWLQKYL